MDGLIDQATVMLALFHVHPSVTVPGVSGIQSAAAQCGLELVLAGDNHLGAGLQPLDDLHVFTVARSQLHPELVIAAAALSARLPVLRALHAADEEHLASVLIQDRRVRHQSACTSWSVTTSTVANIPGLRTPAGLRTTQRIRAVRVAVSNSRSICAMLPENASSG